MEGIVHQLLGWRSYIFSIRFHCITGAFWTSEANLFLETYIVVSFRVRASFLLGGSSQITKWWSFPMAGFLSPQTGCGVSLTNSFLPTSWLACHRTRFLPGSFDLIEVNVSFQRFTAKHYHLERSPYCLWTRWEELWWEDFFFSGEFSLERRVAEASWAGRFFLGGGGYWTRTTPLFSWVCWNPRGIQTQNNCFSPLRISWTCTAVNANRVDIHYASFFSGLPPKFCTTIPSGTGHWNGKCQALGISLLIS